MPFGDVQRVAKSREQKSRNCVTREGSDEEAKLVIIYDGLWMSLVVRAIKDLR